MSLSLRIPISSPMQSIFMPYISLVLPSPVLPSPHTDVVTRPLQVYTCRPHPHTGSLTDSYPIPPPSLALVLQPPNDIPRKGTRSARNPHPMYNFLSYHCLSLPYFAFVITLSSVFTLKSTSEALSHPSWKRVMAEEMDVIYSNGTWELVTLPPILLVVVGFLQ